MRTGFEVGVIRFVRVVIFRVESLWWTKGRVFSGRFSRVGLSDVFVVRITLRAYREKGC